MEQLSSVTCQPKTQKLSDKKLYVASQVSCTSSRIYVKRYEEFITDHGCGVTKDPHEADILLVDTCAASQLKEDESYQVIEKSEKAAKEAAQVIVCGCLAGIDPKGLKQKFNGQFFSPKSEKQLAVILGLDEEESEFLSPIDPRGRFMNGGEYTGGTWQFRLMVRTITLLHHINNWISIEWLPLVGKFLACSQGANSRAYAINISQGCLGRCTFCVIPMAKGRTQSLPLVAITDRIKTMVEKGVKDIILTSEDTGAYGKDIGISIVDLLRRIHEISGNFRIYIHFFDPRWLRDYADELFPILAKGRVRYLQLPIQSASNSVLKRMKRAYQIEQVLPSIEKFRKILKLALSTQIITGFPGETVEEFKCTEDALKENLFDFVQIFEFSDRPGAAAQQIPGHLAKDLLSKRARVLRWTWIGAKFVPFWNSFSAWWRPLRVPVG